MVEGNELAESQDHKSSSGILALGVFLVAIVAAWFLPNQEQGSMNFENKRPKKIGIDFLTELSLPSTSKYKRVVQDEGIRQGILEGEKSNDEREIELESTRRYGYNAWLSDKVPLDRRAYDTRDPQCLKRKYVELSHMPHASVIICVRNDAKSVLLRTIMQVLSRTPTELLREVIVVRMICVRSRGDLLVKTSRCIVSNIYFFLFSM